jgi:nucleotide-binding universal stress UspA family protein
MTMSRPVAAGIAVALFSWALVPCTSSDKGRVVIEFTRILCPIDLSAAATRALVHAAALARWYSASLIILHVQPQPDERVNSGYPGGAELRRAQPKIEEDILAEMAAIVERIGATALKPAFEVAHGRVHRVIVERASAMQADLLVLGTHGSGGYDRALLGSVTEKVIRTATCPVLTVPPGCLPTPAQVAFKRVLCPVDFSPSSLKALHYALDLAEQSHGCVSVLHVLEYMDPAEPREHVDDRIRIDRQHFVEHARQRVHELMSGDRPWCDVKESVVCDERAYTAIIERANAGADLIVMGAQGTGGNELTIYGSNTQQVVRTATCPVLSVRA